MKIKILMLLVLMPSWLSSQTSIPIVNRSVNFLNRKPFYWKINWVDMTEICTQVVGMIHYDNIEIPLNSGFVDLNILLSRTDMAKIIKSVYKWSLNECTHISEFTRRWNQQYLGYN